MNHPKINTHHVQNCSHCKHVIDNVHACMKDKTFLRMARKLTKNTAQAEDLSQMVAQKLIDKAHLYKNNNFKAFAKVMMNRMFLNQIRSAKTDLAKREYLYSIGTINQSPNQSQVNLDNKIFIEEIYNSLDTESEKNLFILLYKGYKHNEIATILDINPNTCHGRIRNLKLKIKKKFSSDK